MRKLAAGSLALAGLLPLGAAAAPSVHFRQPGSQETLSGNLYQSSQCEVGGSNIERVRFWLNGNRLNTEENAPWQCNLDTRGFPDGNYTLYATAWDSSGRSASTGVPVTVRNGAASSGPSVSWRSPSEGATLSGTIEAGSACEVAGSNISRVQFYLDGTQLNTEGGAPYQCYFDTRRFSDGAHTLKAVAYSASGASSSVTRSVSIQNGSSSAGPSVSFRAPASGAAISGVLDSSACEVAGSNVVRTRFWLNGNGLNNDDASPFQCSLDTRKFQDGNYTLYVTGWDASGRKASTGVPVTIRNGGSAGGPTVSFKTPSSGATLSGSISQSSACEVVGSDIDQVAFYIDGRQLNTEQNAPWNCNVDTRQYSDGAHQLMAVASNSAGAKTTTQVAVSIDNGGSSNPDDPPPSGAAVDPSDVMGSARAEVPFSQQQEYFAQVVGTYTSAPQIPDSGIHYKTLSNGETLRFGKQADPTNSARKALAFQLAYTDPTTSGSHRTEISFPQDIEIGKVYWVAYRLYVPDWGTLPTSDVSTAGMQVHGRAPGTSPAVSVNSRGGRTFWIDARHSTSNPPTQSTSTSARSPEIPLPINRWGDIVIKFKVDPNGNGFVQAWVDGAQVWNFNGRVGYFLEPGQRNYIKFGYYNWTNFAGPRKLLMRGMVYLNDPTGSKYRPEDLRAYINANG